MTYQCTCPCLDCVEGRTAGACLEPPDDELQQTWREEWTDRDQDVWGGEEE